MAIWMYVFFALVKLLFLPLSNKSLFPVQAGFMVVRRDTDIFKEIIDVIIEGDYTDGWGWNFGKFKMK